MPTRWQVLSVKFLALLVCLAGGCRPVDAVSGPRGCHRQEGTPSHTPEFLVGQVEGKPRKTPIEVRVVVALRDELRVASDLGMTVLSPEEFRSRHLPLPADVARTIDTLKAAGLGINEERGGIISATGTGEAIKRAFAAELVEGHSGHLPRGEVRLPPKVGAVSGLGRRKNARQWADVQPAGAALSPAAVRRAYTVPEGARGQGQTLAVVALDGYQAADIAAFCRDNNLREVPRRDLKVGIATGEVITESGQVETTLDLALVQALVPEAQEVVVVLGDHRSPHALIDALNRLANPDPGEPLVRHISVSWGSPETGQSQADVLAEARVLLQLAAQGQQVYAASGDNGAYDDGTRSMSTDTPASSPFVMAVGGTSLFVKATGERERETVWQGSGGGLSCFWPTPAWQRSTLRTGELRGMRAVPDVAFNADPDPGYLVRLGDKSLRVGGTSAAAPLWASVGALIDEARAKAKLPPVGFLPPRLYKVAAAAKTRDAFHDILSGANTGNRGAGHAATAGFDVASGWGSPDVARLLEAMAAP